MIKHTDSAIVGGLFVRDAGTGYIAKTESAPLPADEPLVMQLEEKIAKSSIITADIDGTPAEVLPWGYEPALGEIAIERTRGFVRYNSDNIGGILTVTYDPAGSVISAAKLAEMMPPAGLTTTVDVTGFRLTFVDGILTGKDPI